MTKKYEISIGDTLEIGQKSEKEGKVKRQKFVGVLIGKKSTCDQQTIITVRRSAQGFNVEKVFLQEAPQIEYIKTLRQAKVRRAKLYFLRERIGKKARLKKRVQV